jgi:hypothetical protein
VRGTIPLPHFADLTWVVATSDTFDALRGAAKLRGTVGSFDLAAVGAWRSDGGLPGVGLVGGDVRGTLGVGLWLEASLHIEAKPWEEIAVGLDYSFPVLDGLWVMAQYYRSGAARVRGEERSALPLGGATLTPPSCPCAGDDAGGDAASFFQQRAAADPFASPLRGSDYLLLSLREVFVPELVLGITALQSLNDGTGLLLPTVQGSPLGWLTVAASAQIPYRLGRSGGQFKPDDDELVLREDLGGLIGELSADLSGLLPDATVTLWVRVNF